MTQKKRHWWHRSRRAKPETESPLAKAATRVLDKQHAAFLSILTAMGGAPGPRRCPGCGSENLQVGLDETSRGTITLKGEDCDVTVHRFHDRCRACGLDFNYSDGGVKNMATRQEWMQRVPRLRFWQHEPSLVPVVKKLFDEQALSEAELATVRGYIQSWITWLALVPDDAEYVALMEEIEIASQQHLMTRTIDRLLDYGIDPF